MNQALQFIFQIAILIFSVIIHEVSHGAVAYALGDSTAKDEGRLTLNPVNHLDPFGSILLPVLTYLMGGFIFGWAKPVPYNPYNLRAGKWGPAVVAAAGPLTNLFIAACFSLLLRLGPGLPSTALALIGMIILVNLMLAVFNLIPIPPLDGSKILFALIPVRYRHLEEWLRRHQFLLLVLVVLFVANTNFISYLAFSLFRLFTGGSL